jgi:hypothetical protein
VEGVGLQSRASLGKLNVETLSKKQKYWRQVSSGRALSTSPEFNP